MRRSTKLAVSRAEVKVKTLSVSVAELKPKKLEHTLNDRLPEMQVETTHQQRG